MVAELHLLANAAFKDEAIKWAAFGAVANRQGARVAFAFQGEDKFGEAVHQYTAILMSNSGCDDCNGSGSGCGWAGPEDYQCIAEGAPCEEEQAIKYQQRTTGKSTISKEAAYSFRDGFLKKTSKGKQYTDFYYKLSQFGIKSKTLNSDNIADHVKLAILSQDVAEVLENGNDNDIPVTEEFFEESKKMLGIYKKSADTKENREVQAIVSIIDRDLKRYKGQTRATILQQNGW